MTTRTWSQTWTNGSDAGWRAWGSDLSAKFAEVGLVQTSDTGQVNWTTDTRPAPLAYKYEIWRFNDALQATAPLYLRIGYGTAAAGAGALYLQVGTGTDGAGNLTGVVTAASIRCFVGGTLAGSGTNTSYLCYKDGSLGLIFLHSTASGSPTSAFAICRTCDGTGAWTGDGVIVYTRPFTGTTVGPAVVHSLRFAAPAGAISSNVTGGYCVAAHSLTSQVDGKNPIYLNWMPIPQTVPVLGICSHVAAHIPLGTFQAALVGTTVRTYFTIGVGNAGLGYGTDNSNGSSYALAFLWEE